MKSNMIAIMMLGFASLNHVVADDLQFYYDLPSQSTECFIQNLQEADHVIVTAMPIKQEDKIMMMVNNPAGRELDR